MNTFINTVVTSGTALFAGVTLLLFFGCLAVAAHRSPVHRQRLAELAIVATLVWVILAVTPLPRPLARGYFAQLSSMLAEKNPPAPAASAAESSPPTTTTTPLFIATTEVEGIAFDDCALNEPVPSTGEWLQSTPASLTLVPDGGETNPTPAGVSPTATAAAEAPTIVPSRIAAFLQTNWKLLLLGAYAVGVALCALWIALGRGLLAVILWTSKRPEPWLDNLFADLCDERGTRRARLVIAKRYPRAMSFGIFRPTIVLPASQCLPQNAELLRHVLRHELVHVGRCDAWGTLLFNVSFLFLFFHPAFWWLRSRARLSAELVADEWAATRSSRDEYARELIAFVRATRRSTFLPAGATGILGSTTPFSRRIEMLIRRERPLEMHSSPAWRLASCALLGGLIVTMAASLGRTAPTDDDDKDQKVAKTAVITLDTNDLDEDVTKTVTVNVAVEDDDDDAVVQKADGDKDLAKLAAKREALLRESKQLQKKIAKLKQALAESQTQIELQTTDGMPKVKTFKETLEQGQDIDLKKVMKFDVIVTDDDDAPAKKGNKAHAKSGHHPHVMTLKDGKVIELDTKMLDDAAPDKKNAKDHTKEGRHPHTIILKDGGAIEIDGKALDLKGLESLKSLESLKGLESLKDLKSLKDVVKFDVKVIEDEAATDEKPSKDSAKSHKKTEAKKAKAFVIKTKKVQDGDKAGDEHVIIELNSDEGEMMMEIGPDHKVHMKKLKGFDKNHAELEGLMKSLEGVKVQGGPIELKQLGQLKELSELKELGQLQGLLEAAKAMHGEGHGKGMGHGQKKKLMKEAADEEEIREQHFKIESSAEAHRAGAEALKADLEAQRAQFEAQRKVLEKLRQKAEEAREKASESKGDATSKTSTTTQPDKQERRVIVRTTPATHGEVSDKAKAIHEHVLREIGNAKNGLGRLDTYVVQDDADGIEKSHRARSFAGAMSGAHESAAEGFESSGDLMKLAELISNAIGELDQAKAAIEDAAPGSINIHAAESRIRSAERKLRLLSKIAQSLHTAVAAQAKRLHELRSKGAVSAGTVDEIDAKLRIIELILADVKSDPAKSATSVTPASPATPVSPFTPAASVTVTSIAPAVPATAATPVASINTSTIVTSAAPVPATAAVRPVPATPAVAAPAAPVSAVAVPAKK
jgi:beta-lactamase regulating signal transducer with metallopeptidase domain